jgi:hypothetical protein
MFKNLFSACIKPDFCFSQKGNIWRMYFNNTGITVGETRDLNSKEAYLYSFDFKTKEIFLKNYQIQEKWWFSIESVNDIYVYLGRFFNPEDPEPIGIYAHDIKTGSEVWSNKDLIFYFSDNDFVFGLKRLFESKILYKLNANSGEIIEELRTDEEMIKIIEQKKENDLKMYDGYLYPEIYNLSENDLVFEAEVDFADKAKIEGPLEFIRFNNFLIFNYHIKQAIDLKNIERQILSNILHVKDKAAGKLIHTETLNKITSSYVPDSFFMKDGYLFYVKEKKDLISINMNNLQ